jgi:hypothetical protein
MAGLSKIMGVSVGNIAKYNGIDAASIESVIGATWSHSLVIGAAFGGGFYAGQISTTANGVATHYLVISPQSTAVTGTSSIWGPTGTNTGINSLIDGPANTASLVALGSSYKAANYCNNLTTGGYSDWYLPAFNELLTMYYNLKPSTVSNVTTSDAVGVMGYNANAVSPEPINTGYTTTNPLQTTSAAFKTSGSEHFGTFTYRCSTDYSSDYAREMRFHDGYRYLNNVKTPSYYGMYVRAIRRVAV